MRIKKQSYITIARPAHWFKNIFILPGTIIAITLNQTPIKQMVVPFCLGLISVCLIASANYVLNEWVDAEFDKFHPLKKNRPLVKGEVKKELVYIEYLILMLSGFGLGVQISRKYLLVLVIFVVMGLLYNVKPFRTKDRVYLDVLSESFNNPIRLTLGWFTVTSAILPPSSLLFGYWMGGALLMNIKRYAEYRYFADPKIAGQYRHSFLFYTEQRLLVASFFYGTCSAFFLGVFLTKYRVELLFSLPFFALLFAWYFHIGMEANSIAQNPERLFRKKGFLIYFILLVIIVSLLLFVDMPWMSWFLKNAFINK